MKNLITFKLALFAIFMLLSCSNDNAGELRSYSTITPEEVAAFKSLSSQLDALNTEHTSQMEDQTRVIGGGSTQSKWVRVVKIVAADAIGAVVGTAVAGPFGGVAGAIGTSTAQQLLAVA